MCLLGASPGTQVQGCEREPTGTYRKALLADSRAGTAAAGFIRPIHTHLTSQHQLGQLDVPAGASPGTQVQGCDREPTGTYRKALLADSRAETAAAGFIRPIHTQLTSQHQLGQLDVPAGASPGTQVQGCEREPTGTYRKALLADSRAGTAAAGFIRPIHTQVTSQHQLGQLDVPAGASPGTQVQGCDREPTGTYRKALLADSRAETAAAGFIRPIHTQLTSQHQLGQLDVPAGASPGTQVQGCEREPTGTYRKALLADSRAGTAAAGFIRPIHTHLTSQHQLGQLDVPAGASPGTQVQGCDREPTGTYRKAFKPWPIQGLGRLQLA